MHTRGSGIELVSGSYATHTPQAHFQSCTFLNGIGGHAHGQMQQHVCRACVQSMLLKLCAYCRAPLLVMCYIGLRATSRAPAGRKTCLSMNPALPWLLTATVQRKLERLAASAHHGFHGAACAGDAPASLGLPGDASFASLLTAPTAHQFQAWLQQARDRCHCIAGANPNLEGIDKLRKRSVPWCQCPHAG